MSELTQETFSVLQSKATPNKGMFGLRLDAFYHQANEEPFAIPTVICSTPVEPGDTEPYSRKIKVSEVSRQLDLGDIEREDVGYIILVNLVGTKLHQNPTREEHENLLKKVIVFGDSDGLQLEIHPFGTPLVAQVGSLGPLSVRCLHGEAILKEFIFPR